MVFWTMIDDRKVCWFKTKQELLHSFPFVESENSSGHSVLKHPQKKKRKEKQAPQNMSYLMFLIRNLLRYNWNGMTRVEQPCSLRGSSLSGALKFLPGPCNRLRCDLWWWQNSKHIWAWWNVFSSRAAADWRSLGINCKLHAHPTEWKSDWRHWRTKGKDTGSMEDIKDTFISSLFFGYDRYESTGSHQKCSSRSWLHKLTPHFP